MGVVGGPFPRSDLCYSCSWVETLDRPESRRPHVVPQCFWCGSRRGQGVGKEIRWLGVGKEFRRQGLGKEEARNEKLTKEDRRGWNQEARKSLTDCRRWQEQTYEELEPSSSSLLTLDIRLTESSTELRRRGEREFFGCEGDSGLGSSSSRSSSLRSSEQSSDLESDWGSLSRGSTSDWKEQESPQGPGGRGEDTMRGDSLLGKIRRRVARIKYKLSIAS